MDPTLLDAIKTFGALPVTLGVVIYLLRQANDERQKLTDRLLTTLEKTISDNTTATREATATNSSEHARILDFLQRSAPPRSA